MSWLFHQTNKTMVIFKYPYKIHIIGQNKNGYGPYSFSEDNYNAGYCGSGYTLTGDIPKGNPTYDSATANMGEPWVMFTKDQGYELINIDNTTSEWISINEVNGYKFTSKSDISKYIFLQAGSVWGDSPISNIGVYGHFWTNSIHSDDSKFAWGIHFDSSRFFMTNGHFRQYGAPIRPVAPPKPW